MNFVKSKNNLLFLLTIGALAGVIVTLAYQVAKKNKALHGYHLLLEADRSLFSQEFEKALSQYGGLDEEFLSEEEFGLRKEFIAFIQRNNIAEGVSKEELIEALLYCNPLKEKSDLIEKPLSVLIPELIECQSTIVENKNYKSEALSRKGSIQYVRIKRESRGDNIHYFGETANDMANGQGIGIWDSNSFYEGEWKDNKRHGFGKFVTEKGELYEGIYQNDKRNGQGIYTFRNGDYYTGEWEDSKRSGLGTVINAKGDTIVHGFWKNDRYDRQRSRNM